MPLRIEVGDGLGRWAFVGDLAEGMAPGSISGSGPDGPEVYIFDCEGPDSSVICQAPPDHKVIEEGKLFRVIVTSNLKLLKRLKMGERYEVPVDAKRLGMPYIVRFTHVEEGAPIAQA